MKRLLKASLMFLITAVTMSGCAGERLTLRKGERIVFFGDSITELGVKPKGYVTLIRDDLNARYPDMEIQVIGAGVSGNKVADLQKRLNRDVLEKKPTIVVIYIGINDVWHWQLKNLQGTSKEAFEKGLREIIARMQFEGAEVVLCTPSVIGERTDSTYRQNAMLNEYSGISRRVADKMGVPLCDLHRAFDMYLAEHNKENMEKGILTTDGVHLNDDGNKLVAHELLKILGGG